MVLLKLIFVSEVVCVCVHACGWVEGMVGGVVEAFPAREPTGMFSTSEPRAEMRRNNKAQ